MKIEFIACRTQFPYTHYLCVDGEPIMDNGLYFHYYLSTKDGPYRVYDNREGFNNETLLTKEQYEWIKSHPEEIYMELFL